MRHRILAAFALAVAFIAPIVLAQTALPPPGQIGDQTFNKIRIQDKFTVDTTAGILFGVPINYGVDAGSTDSYVAAIAPAPTAYVTGALYILVAATANTGAASVNFNGIGAATIVKAVSTTLSNNDIVANMLCLMVYNGTNMVLLNPRAL